MQQFFAKAEKSATDRKEKQRTKKVGQNQGNNFPLTTCHPADASKICIGKL